MYHERTQKELNAARARRVIVACVVVAVLILGALGLAAFQESAREQGAASVRKSVLETSMQCFAIEGSYPSSLKHLQEVYGLTINENDYIVNYEWFADNIPPSVAVTVR